MASSEKTISFRAVAEKIDTLDSLAAAQDRSRSYLINEAITNAIKYAFPVTKKGKIMIRLEQDQESNMKLVIRDNGVGLPDFFNDNNNTLGKNLIIGLSEQLQGELIMENNFGTQLSVVFKLLDSK